MNSCLQTFAKGKFDDVRACCYELLSLNVGIRNVAPVTNPRRAHALARVTVVGVCVCLSVWTKSASTGI